ncbi:MAG: hypothetical protein C0490_11200, partial [Marivirga sp.]|nr:hypothetical protein [Marivirga sp.]
EYFKSLPGRKLVLFDPFEDKSIFLRSMNVNMEDVIVLKKLTLRQTFSVMADKRVGLILGPCTGLMHAASGIYNSLIKRSLRSSIPILLVYTGLYQREGIQNTLVWWRGSLAKCLVLKSDENGNKYISNIMELEESELTFQVNLLPCRDYTSEMVQDYLYRNYNIGMSVIACN